MIKAELDKKPAEAIRTKLDKALTDAEREATEKERSMTSAWRLSKTPRK